MNHASDFLSTLLCVLAIPSGLVVALLKFAFSPMSITRHARIEREREHNLLAGILLVVFGGIIGIAVVFLVLISALVKSSRLQTAQAPQGDTRSVRLAPPLLPRIALEELLCMVLGIAAYPILIFGTEFTAVKGYPVILMMVLGALLYPLCALAAYNRANANHIPVCGARTVYIALFPLMFFACVFQPLTLLVMQTNGINASSMLQLGLGTVVTVLETFASWHAKCAGRRAAVLSYDSTGT
jgi:hypothetical protein